MTYIEVVHQNLHLQGFAKGGDFMYWSFTDSLVKTTLAGTVKCQVEMRDGHLGDCDYYDGKIYASMLGHPASGRPWNDWSSFCIYVYSADDLRLLQKIRLDVCDRYWKELGTDADTRGFSGVDGVTVTFNGTAWAQGTNYTYDEVTGQFATIAGQVTVPAATFVQDPTTGEWTVTPGTSILTIVGTI